MKRLLRVLCVLAMIACVIFAIATVKVLAGYLSDLRGNWGPILQMLVFLAALVGLFLLCLRCIRQTREPKKAASPAKPASPGKVSAPAAPKPASPNKPSAPAAPKPAPPATEAVQPPAESPQAPEPSPAKAQDETAPVEEKPMLDDVSYIRDMKHTAQGIWQRYDVLLDTRGYGWMTMVDWAAYMESADLDGVGTLTTAEIAGAAEQEWIKQYRTSGKSMKEFEPLQAERGVLGIGGISRTLRCPTKVYWFNQTRVLRVFTMVSDETQMRKYVETMIRRTFGTDDAMRLARPAAPAPVKGSK